MFANFLNCFCVKFINWERKDNFKQTIEPILYVCFCSTFINSIGLYDSFLHVLFKSYFVLKAEFIIRCKLWDNITLWGLGKKPSLNKQEVARRVKKQNVDYSYRNQLYDITLSSPNYICRRHFIHTNEGNEGNEVYVHCFYRYNIRFGSFI